jgi:16S rRNA (adenine1518-N6/adenine1519-N6)-dimethyltransferase
MAAQDSHSSQISNMVYAKKSLGQNFLQSKGALRSIITAGKLSADDTVLEIGPGKGALTEGLLATGAKVIAVEKDRELISFLEEKFGANKNFTLIEGDILLMNTKDLKLKEYKLIANIPYYITGEIIRKFLEEKNQPKLMVLLVQKEVAERIVARDGKESILSIAIRAYATPKFVAKVPRGAFVPAPNVDSAIVAFENISKDFFTKNKVSEKDFFTVVKTGFAHKRKKLSGNLKEISETLNKEFFESIKEKRAEELSLEDWGNLLLKR